MFRINSHLGTLALAVLLLSLVGIFARFLEPTSGYIATLFGYIVVVILSLAWILGKGQKKELVLKGKRVQLLLLALGQLGSAAFYMQAVHYIDLAVAALLLYSAPVWVVLFYLLSGEEKLGRKFAIPLGLGLLGLFLVTNPESFFSESLNIGLLLGMLAGISYAVSFVYARKVKDTYKTSTIVFWNHLIGAIILAPLLTIFSFRTDLLAVTWYIGIGLSWALGYVLLYYSLRFVKAHHASLIALLEPVFVAAWGFFIFKETLGIIPLFGAVILLANVFIINRMMKS
jgi:drug/metabolite transporter (DMT)-like permease